MSPPADWTAPNKIHPMQVFCRGPSLAKPANTTLGTVKFVVPEVPAFMGPLHSPALDGHFPSGKTIINSANGISSSRRALAVKLGLSKSKNMLANMKIENIRDRIDECHCFMSASGVIDMCQLGVHCRCGEVRGEMVVSFRRLLGKFHQELHRKFHTHVSYSASRTSFTQSFLT